MNYLFIHNKLFISLFAYFQFWFELIGGHIGTHCGASAQHPDTTCSRGYIFFQSFRLFVSQ